MENAPSERWSLRSKRSPFGTYHTERAPGSETSLGLFCSVVHWIVRGGMQSCPASRESSPNRAGDRLSGKAHVAVHLRPRRGRAEVVEPNNLAFQSDVSAPTQRRAGFDRDTGA